MPQPFLLTHPKISSSTEWTSSQMWGVWHLPGHWWEIDFQRLESLLPQIPSHSMISVARPGRLSWWLSQSYLWLRPCVISSSPHPHPVVRPGPEDLSPPSLSRRTTLEPYSEPISRAGCFPGNPHLPTCFPFSLSPESVSLMEVLVLYRFLFCW